MQQVKTRDGRDARIVDRNYKGNRIVAIVAYQDGREEIIVYEANGKYWASREHPLDLMLTKTQYVNVYPDTKRVWVYADLAEALEGKSNATSEVFTLELTRDLDGKVLEVKLCQS